MRLAVTRCRVMAILPVSYITSSFMKISRVRALCAAAAGSPHLDRGSTDPIS